MTNEQLQQTINVTKQQHQQWLQHPTTQDMLAVMAKHEESIINIIETLGGVSQDSGYKESLLQLATQLKTIRSVRKLLINSEAFVSKLYPQE